MIAAISDTTIMDEGSIPSLLPQKPTNNATRDVTVSLRERTQNTNSAKQKHKQQISTTINNKQHETTQHIDLMTITTNKQ